MFLLKHSQERKFNEISQENRIDRRRLEFAKGRGCRRHSAKLEYESSSNSIRSPSGRRKREKEREGRSSHPMTTRNLRVRRDVISESSTNQDER